MLIWNFRFNTSKIGSIVPFTSLSLPFHFPLTPPFPPNIYVSPCKRPSFDLQKTTFHHPKDRLSQVNDRAFGNRPVTFGRPTLSKPLRDNPLREVRQNRSTRHVWRITPPDGFRALTRVKIFRSPHPDFNTSLPLPAPLTTLVKWVFAGRDRDSSFAIVII